MPKQFDTPKCCKEAALLIMWMPKGVPQEKYAKAVREYRDLNKPRPTCGPRQEGWCTLIESGGPGVHNEYINVVCCPFCGTELAD